MKVVGGVDKGRGANTKNERVKILKIIINMHSTLQSPSLENDII